MILPAEVKMQLERKAIDIGVSIVGVHSIRLTDDDTVSAIFEVTPDEDGSGLHLSFPMPQYVTKDDLPLFAQWLAAQHVGTVH
jgi:hypothetical protein